MGLFGEEEDGGYLLPFEKLHKLRKYQLHHHPAVQWGNPAEGDYQRPAAPVKSEEILQVELLVGGVGEEAARRQGMVPREEGVPHKLVAPPLLDSRLEGGEGEFVP